METVPEINSDINTDGPGTTRRMERRGLDPFSWYRQMRSEHPIFYDTQSKMWQLFRYNDVLNVLTKPALFSSQRGIAVTTDEEQQLLSLIVTDPPRHRQLRALVSQVFTPRMIEQMTEHIREIVSELLDAVLERGKMDIIADLGYPLPVIVIAEMLGVPLEDRDDFKQWSDLVVSSSQEQAEAGTAALYEYFRHQVANRREHHQDDLVGRLVDAHMGEQSLTETEVIVFCTLLMVAGNETTTNLIGNALWCFDEYPEVWDQLREDRSLVPSALEEVLRFRSPVQMLGRGVLQDTEIGGQPLKAGEYVLSWIGAANRDEAQFPDPDVFDIRRSPNRNIAFGHGIHFCLGAHLARLESRIALEGLLDRFSEVRRIREEPLHLTPSFFALGVEHLPVTLKR